MTSADGSSPFKGEDKLIEETTEAKQKLSMFNDASDAKKTEFAHLLADRLNPQLVPVGFLLAATLLIYDLRKGVNGFTDEPMNSILVGLSEAEYSLLQCGLVDLAKVAFSPIFAEEVEMHANEAGIVAPSESVEGKNLTEGEIITDSIVDIEDAYREIVVDARERVANLDWQHFGISTEEVYAIYEMAYKLNLRLAPYHLPISFLAGESSEDKALLMKLPDNRKKDLSKEAQLIMTVGEIDSEYATFARDHLFLKAPEVIAGMKGLNVKETLVHLAGGANVQDGPISRAAIRLHSFLQENPSILREGETYP